LAFASSLRQQDEDDRVSDPIPSHPVSSHPVPSRPVRRQRAACCASGPASRWASGQVGSQSSAASTSLGWLIEEIHLSAALNLESEKPRGKIFSPSRRGG